MADHLNSSGEFQVDHINRRPSQIAARRYDQHTLRVARPTRWKTVVPYGIFGLVVLGYAFLSFNLFSNATKQYDQINLLQTKETQPLTQTIPTKVGQRAIALAAHNPFRSSSVWAYVSDKTRLPANYSPQLVTVKVATSSDTAPARMQPIAARALEKLFVAANKAGHPLAAVSAYRSISDQKDVYTTYVETQGVAAANAYVAAPGASEHHTGLAVDVDNFSAACINSSLNCGLSIAAADWLAANAPKYGFIIRYPKGKESVTGINYEPWHLRYIGNQAESLASSGMTLDELVKKVEKAR